jgi:dTDP-4-amino-4,6-dideoxy-D-galactose acyltransferase
MFEELSWDTDFFGFGVGRLHGDMSQTRLPEIYKEMAAKNIRLAYYFSEKAVAFPQNRLYHAQLMDIKVTYLKDVDVHACDEHVQPYSKEYPDAKLIALAIESGVYSRFKKDEAIPVSKYEELYKMWIVNSVNKKIANEVLVYKIGNIIAGFVTIGEKNKRADIGIIAVDSEFRGRGIGKALMISAEYVASSNFKIIQVVTQGSNTAACKLYTSCGYSIESVFYVYHLWKKS